MGRTATHERQKHERHTTRKHLDMTPPPELHTIPTQPDPWLLLALIGLTLLLLVAVQWWIERPDRHVRLDRETVRRLEDGRSGWTEARP